MKRTIQFLGAMSLCLLSFNSFSQQSKEIRKEVKMEEVNGEKVMTIITEEDGKKTEEVYKGAEADKKLAEMENSTLTKEQTEEVKVETIKGEKVVTVTKKTTESETVEVYTGEDADKKLKEMEKGEPGKKKEIKTVKRIEIEKTEKE